MPQDSSALLAEIDSKKREMQKLRSDMGELSDMLREMAVVQQSEMQKLVATLLPAIAQVAAKDSALATSAEAPAASSEAPSTSTAETDDGDPDDQPAAMAAAPAANTKGERSLESEPGPNVAEALPRFLQLERRLHFDTAKHDLSNAAVALLERAGERLGRFPEAAQCAARLEDFRPTVDVFRNFKARQSLYQAVSDDPAFLAAYERLVIDVVLPWLKDLLLYAPRAVQT